MGKLVIKCPFKFQGSVPRLKINKILLENPLIVSSLIIRVQLAESLRMATFFFNTLLENDDLTFYSKCNHLPIIKTRASLFYLFIYYCFLKNESN